MKKILIPILIGFSLATVSCTAWLDIDKKGVIAEDEYYASDSHAEALLANMYASLQGANGVAGSSGIYNPQLMILNYSADDVLAAGSNAEDHSEFRVFDEFRYDDSNAALLNLYNGYVTGINAANLIISHFTNENADGEEPFFTSESRGLGTTPPSSTWLMPSASSRAMILSSSPDRLALCPPKCTSTRVPP